MMEVEHRIVGNFFGISAKAVKPGGSGQNETTFGSVSWVTRKKARWITVVNRWSSYWRSTNFDPPSDIYAWWHRWPAVLLIEET